MKLTNTPQANYRPASCLKFNQYFFFIYLFSTATLIFLITRYWDRLYTKFSSVRNYIGPVRSWSHSLGGFPQNKPSRFILSHNLRPCPPVKIFPLLLVTLAVTSILKGDGGWGVTHTHTHTHAHTQKARTCWNSLALCLCRGLESTRVIKTAECWCWRATANSLIALPSWINIHGLIYNLIILTQALSVSDDRPSNAHLSVNHAGCSLDRSGGKADCRHRESLFSCHFNMVSCTVALIYSHVCVHKNTTLLDTFCAVIKVACSSPRVPCSPTDWVSFCRCSRIPPTVQKHTRLIDWRLHGVCVYPCDLDSPSPPIVTQITINTKDGYYLFETIKIYQ